MDPIFLFFAALGLLIGIFMLFLLDVNFQSDISVIRAQLNKVFHGGHIVQHNHANTEMIAADEDDSSNA